MGKNKKILGSYINKNNITLANGTKLTYFLC